MSRVVYRSSIVAAFTLMITGCGPKLVAVTGVVNFDGKPLESATVNFVSEDGATTYSGFTDASGNFKLSQGEKSGAMPGNYKVTVVKTPKIAGSENMNPGDPNYMKQMEKMGKDAAKSSGPGKMFPGAVAPGGPGSEVKTEIPKIYASASTTPLTAKVPPDNQPIVFDLKSKP